MPRDSTPRRPDRPLKKPEQPGGAEGEVVRLEDLVPRKEVRGGNRKRLFGEETSSGPDRRRGGR